MWNLSAAFNAFLQFQETSDPGLQHSTAFGHRTDHRCSSCLSVLELHGAVSLPAAHLYPCTSLIWRSQQISLPGSSEEDQPATAPAGVLLSPDLWDPGTAGVIRLLQRRQTHPHLTDPVTRHNITLMSHVLRESCRSFAAAWCFEDMSTILIVCPAV